MEILVDPSSPFKPILFQCLRKITISVKHETFDTVYIVGDKRKGNTYVFYFCDAPTHKDREKWHTHATDTCRTRQRWLRNKGSGLDSFPRPATNIDKLDTDSSSTQSIDDISTKTDSNQDDNGKPPPVNNHISTLLASTLNAVGDNDIVRHLIADAINAASWHEMF